MVPEEDFLSSAVVKVFISSVPISMSTDPPQLQQSTEGAKNHSERVFILSVCLSCTWGRYVKLLVLSAYLFTSFSSSSVILGPEWFWLVLELWLPLDEWDVLFPAWKKPKWHSVFPNNIEYEVWSIYWIKHDIKVE